MIKTHIMNTVARFCTGLVLGACAAAPAAWAQAANTGKPAPPAANTAPAANPTTPANATAPAAGTTGIAGVVGGDNAAFTDRIPADQIVTLDAGGDKFNAWHIADLTGQPRGAVIVLPASGHVPSWPHTAAALIDDLPLHGWSVLNIELPLPVDDTLKAETTVPDTAAPAPPPASSSAPSPTPSPAPTPTPTPAAAGGAASAPTATATPAVQPPEVRVQARIDAAIKYFTDQKQRNIVLIGFGSGAIRAADTLQRLATANKASPGTPAPITALVMIAPRQRLDGIDGDLPKLLPVTGVPALDLTLDSAAQTRADAEARRRAVLRQRSRTYTQLELPPLNGASAAEDSVMVKRVRSWLEKNASTAR